MTSPLFCSGRSFDPEQFRVIAALRGLRPDEVVSMLPEGGKIGGERRFLYFYQALDGTGLNSEPVLNQGFVDAPPPIRIAAFGKCNVGCPYCKRGCQFITEDGTPLVAEDVAFEDIARLCAGAVERGETVRFSGGDPVTYPKQTLALAEYLCQVHGVKVSIAHNGSGPAWVRRMLPYLSSAAIDLKAVPEKIGAVMGIASSRGLQRYQSSLACQRLLSQEGVLVDVRTPIFGDTSLGEMLRMAADIGESNYLSYTFWTWRLYKPVAGCDWPIPVQEDVIAMMEAVSAQFPDLWLGLRAKWEKGGMLYFRRGGVV